MMPVTYHLADVDGVLCIRCEQADYNRPMLVSCYWPTIATTRDFRRYHECSVDDLLSRFEVTQSTPGEFVVRDRQLSSHFAPVFRLALTNGGQTSSIHASERPYDPPKRAREKEYHGGHWHVVRSGKWVRA